MHTDEHHQLVACAYKGQELTHRGSWLTRLCCELHELQLKDGYHRDGLAALCIPDWLKSDRRIEQVDSHILHIPVGWPGEFEKEEVGSAMAQNSTEIFKSLRPYALSRGISEDEYNLWEQGFEADMKSQAVKTYVPFHYCTARVR